MGKTHQSQLAFYVELPLVLLAFFSCVAWLNNAGSEKAEEASSKVNIMKQRKEEGDGFESTTKKVVPQSTPPPPPPHPKFRVYLRPRAEESVTKREIAKFWRQKRIEEEDHLLAAIKAAARLRARNLSEQEYWNFELFLKTYLDEDEPKEEMDKRVAAANDRIKDEKDKEVCVGIKDWWTKSKYAYLNQPALDSMDPSKKRTSTYVPNCPSYQLKALYPTAIGVF